MPLTKTEAAPLRLEWDNVKFELDTVSKDVTTYKTTTQDGRSLGLVYRHSRSAPFYLDIEVSEGERADLMAFMDSINQQAKP